MATDILQAARTAAEDLLRARIEALPVNRRRKEIGKLYKEAVGYNPFEDDPANTTEEIAEVLIEYAGEEAYYDTAIKLDNVRGMRTFRASRR